MPTLSPPSPEARKRKIAADRKRRALVANAGEFLTPPCEHCDWREFRRTQIGAKVSYGLHLRRAHGIFGASMSTPPPPRTLAAYKRGEGQNFDSGKMFDLLALAVRR